MYKSKDEVKIKKITRINFTGKWVEFWFECGEKNIERFDACCKSYMLSDVDYTPEGHVDNFGYVGLNLAWLDGCDRPSAMFIGDKNED